MKIGAGGLQSMIVNEQITARRPEQLRAAPTLEEELAKKLPLGENKSGPELNKPVFNPENAAYMSNHLKNKELKTDERPKEKENRAKQDSDKQCGTKKGSQGKENITEDASGFFINKLV